MVVLSCTGKDQTSVQLIWLKSARQRVRSLYKNSDKSMARPKTDCIYAGQNQSRLKREWLREEERVVKECWVYFRVSTQPE